MSDNLWAACPGARSIGPERELTQGWANLGTGCHQGRGRRPHRRFPPSDQEVRVVFSLLLAWVVVLG